MSCDLSPRFVLLCFCYTSSSRVCFEYFIIFFDTNPTQTPVLFIVLTCVRFHGPLLFHFSHVPVFCMNAE